MPQSVDYDTLVDQATTAPPASPPPGSPNYDDLAGQVIDMQAAVDRQRAQKNLALAQGSNPDAEAKALQASKALGIPQPAASANLQEATQSADLQKNMSTLAAAPGLSAFIGSNPLAARIAQDDFDKLGVLDRMWTALKSGWNTAVDSNALGRLGTTKQAAGLIGLNTPDTDQAIQTVEGRIAATPRLSGALGTVQQFTGFLAGMIDNAAQGGGKGALAGGAIGAAAGAPAAGIGAVPGAVAGAATGGVIGFNVDMAQVAAGNAYLKMGQMRGADGQPLSEAGKQFGAIFTGAATYAIGKYAGAAESKILGTNAEKIAQQAVERAVQTPTFARAAASFAEKTATGAGAGAAVMTSMEASAILGEQIAKAMSSGDFANDPQEMVNRLSEAALNGAVTLGALHATRAGVELYGDARAASRAQAQATMFKSILDGSAESKTRQRDLDTFQQFMQAQTDGSPVEDLHIPAAKVRELYQSMAIDPATLEAGKDPIFGFVPDMAKQLAEGASTGGDVVIPTADFVTHLAGSPIAERLLPDIRVGADAMSLNEAKAFQDNYNERIKQAVEEAAGTPKEPDSAQQIADDVRQRATAAGRPAAEASRYGQIFAARYVARAERRGLGEDPAALYKAEGAQIGDRGASPEGRRSRELNQEALPEEHVGTTLMALSKHDELFQYPKSSAKDLETIAKDKNPAIKIERETITQMDGAEKATGHYRVTLPGGRKATIQEKDGKVWINASGVGEGKGGSLLYDLAANYAHSNGLKFIGDPDGLSAAGMRRRLENMLSSSVKYGTTEHLEPHERQLRGEADLGLPPLAWENGSHAENIRSMVRAQVATNEHASPLGTSLEYDAHADAFRDASGNVVEGPAEVFRVLAGEDRAAAGAGAPGRTSVQRTALFRALLRSADERRALLERLRGEPGSAGGADGGSLARSFYQAVGDDRRGKIRFDDAHAVISLFEKADSSTLIHEAGHAWLEELATDAGAETAPAQLRQDMASVREWLGNDGGEFTTEQHEQFARAAEAYLMEGKAPSHALAQVFSRFKQWLTKIYRTVAALDTPINDDIRGVFDRLLATDTELAEATKSTGLEPNFKDRAEAGMTEAEWEAYTRSIDKAKQQAESAMLDKMMATVRRQRTKEFQEERTRVAEDVAKTVDARPDMRALKLLRSGRMPDGHEVRVRLNTDLMRETYGKDGFEALPKGLTAKDGVSPDAVNEMLGAFDSGDEMVRALQSLEGQQREIRQTEGEGRGIRQYLIDQETDARMAERKGELEDEASIKDEAQAALHGAGQLELLANEMRYLRRRVAQEVKVRGAAAEGAAEERAALKQKLGDEKMTARWNQAEENTTRAAMREAVAITRPMLQEMRQRVEEILAGKTTDELDGFNRYLRDERKAAREVQEAILAKDWKAAADAKQRQIISHMLYRGGRDASFEVDQGLKTFKRMASLRSFKTIDGKYVDQIQDLLGRFGFDSRRGDELQRTKAMTLEKFVETRYEDHGIELQVDPALFTMPGKPVGQLTLSEFRALREAVDSMKEMGEGEKTIVIENQKLNFEEVRDEIVAAIRDLGERMKSDYYDPADAGKLAAAKEAIFAKLRGIDASLTKPEALFDQIDRGDPSGIMNRAVFRPLKEAQHHEDEWQDVAAKSLKKAVDAAGKGWSKHLNDAIPDDLNLVNPETGKPMKLTRQRMLSMALNWGNEGNRQKLADGYKWDQRVVKAFLDRNMTKADWNFVQDVWGIFDQNREALDALQKRVTGAGLDLVKADSFLTPHGEYAGGYFPVVYDASRSFATEAHVEKANTEALFQNGFQRATTPKGSTIARQENVKRAIQLSLDVAPRKIGQVIHDIAFREAIMDADRLLDDGHVKRAFDDVFGSEYRKTLRPWLQHLANSRNIDDAAIGWIDKAIQTARTNTVMVGIGFRLSTIIKHDLTALANSIGEIGGKEMLKATTDLYRRDDHGNNSWKFIFDKSAEMRFRQNAYDKDVMASYQNLMGDSRYTAFQKTAQHYGHWAVSKLDMGTAGPVWLSSYRKALAEGRNDADAVYIADKSVRNAHGAQGLTDTAQIQRARGAAQLINMFYGFFNHVYNRQRLIAIDAASGIKNLRQGERKAAIHDFASVLARSFWYIAVPGLIEAIVANQGPNENKDEGWGEWGAKAVLGSVPAGIPILRDIAKAVIEGRDYEGSPLVNAVNSVIRGGIDVAHMANGEEASPNAGKHIATAVGLAAGLPTAAPFTAGKFLWDYGSGEASPQTIGEWYRGLTTGKTEK